MKLLKRLTIPTLALLALSMFGGCGKPLESGEGAAEGQRGRDSAALQQEKQRKEEADKLLQDGYVKVGQVLSMAHFAVQAKLPGNAGLSTVPLAVAEPAAEPAPETAISPATEGVDAASAPDSTEPAAEGAPAEAAAEGAPTDDASAEGAPTDDASAEGAHAEVAPAADAAAEGAPADAAAPGEDHQMTAADEALVEPAGPVMPEVLAHGTLSNDMLSQAYALLEAVKAEVAPLLNGEYDNVLDDAARERIISLQELLAVSEDLIYTGSYLLPINEDVVELIKQAREAAEAPAEGDAAAAEGAPAEGDAAAAEGAPAEGDAAAAEGAPAEGDAASSEAPAAEESAPSSEAPAAEGAAKGTESAAPAAPASH